MTHQAAGTHAGTGMFAEAFAASAQATWPDLSAATLAQVQAAFRPRALAKGQAWVRAQSTWDEMAWIASGGLRLFYLDRQGREWNKNFHLAGAWLWPLTPSMQAGPVNFEIAALAATELWVAPWREVERLVNGSHAWQQRSAQALCGLLDDKLQREQRLLQCSAQERYQALCAEHPDWLAVVPLRHLASYLGMTDVSLSRLRAEQGQGRSSGRNLNAR